MLVQNVLLTPVNETYENLSLMTIQRVKILSSPLGMYHGGNLKLLRQRYNIISLI